MVVLSHPMESSEIGFSKNIKTHATIVGVLLVLGTIFAFALGASWHLIVKDIESTDSLQAVRNALLVIGAINLLLTIVYWIGFLKRVRWCITVCLVCVILAFALSALSLFLHLISLETERSLNGLIVLGIKGYFWLVLARMRTMMVNGSLEDSAQVYTMTKGKNQCGNFVTLVPEIQRV